MHNKSIFRILSFAFVFYLLPTILPAQIRLGIGGGGYFGLKDQGIHAGLQVQKDYSDFGSIRLQIALTDKPSNLPNKNLNPDFDYVAGRISYLILPIEYQYFIPFKNLRAGAFGGPYFAYGLNAGILKKQNNFNFEKIDLDFEEQGIRRLDLGVHLGVGLELELPRLKRMFLRVHYALGLVDIDLGDASTYQEGVGVLMGLLVPIKGWKED